MESPLTTYKGYDDNDLHILERYRLSSTPQSGFVVNFVGAKTSVGIGHDYAHLSGTVEGMPVPSNFHGETIEWLGTLRAVEGAQDSFNVAEIGAAWGPWLVSSGLAARRRGIKDIFMVGIEANTGHYTAMLQHLRDNDFDPSEHLLLHGILGPKDGTAYFPRIDASVDRGAGAVFSEKPPTVDYRGLALEFDPVRSFSLETALARRPIFDLVHMDIQGGEKVVLPAAITMLSQKTRWFVLGTHSRQIEGQMFDLFSINGWALAHEKPCKICLNSDAEPLSERHTVLDGTQVWRNPRLT